jgi:hypothetical protein
MQLSLPRKPAPPGVSDLDPAPLRWHDWPFAVAVAFATIGLCFFATFALPDLLGYDQWQLLGDGETTIRAAQWVSWGGIGNVYAANPQYLPLPGFLILLAPVVALGDHLGLVIAYPFPIPRPSMLLVAAPVFFVTGASAILGADYLADTLGISRRRRRPIAVAIGLLVVIPTCTYIGHPEDLVAIALSCVSVALLLRRHYLGAAIVLSLAIMMQSWAVLLIPLLIAASPPGRRLLTLAWSAALPAACASMLLVLDFHDAYRSLVLQPMVGLGQHLPWWNLAGHLTTLDSVTHRVAIGQARSSETFVTPVVALVGSTSRSLAVVAAIVVAVMVWRRPTHTAIMTAASVALLARGVFETQVWCYYLAPAAVFMVLAAAGSGVTGRRWCLGALSALVAYSCAAGAYNPHRPYSMAPFLALGILLTSGVGVVLATRPQPSEQPGRDQPAESPVAPDHEDRAPALV